MDGKIYSALPPISPSQLSKDGLDSSDVEKQNHTRPSEETSSDLQSKTIKMTAKPGKVQPKKPAVKSEINTQKRTPPSDTKRQTDITTTTVIKKDTRDVTKAPQTSVLFQLGKRMARLYLCDDHSCSSCIDDHSYILSKNESCSESIAQRLLYLGMLELFQEICRKFLHKAVVGDTESKETIVMSLICSSIASMTDASADVCRRAIQMDLDIELINFLKSDELNPTLKGKAIGSSCCELVEDLMTILYNIIQLNDEARERFRAHDIVHVLQRYMSNTSDSLSCQTMIFLAWIINEEENDILESNEKIFEFLEKELRSSVENVSHRSHFGYKTREVLMAINKLAVNDNNKDRIVQSGVLTSYTKLLQTSDEVQIQFLAAQGIWTLASKCAEAMKKDVACIESLEQLLKKSEDKGVRNQLVGSLSALGCKVETNKNSKDVGNNSLQTNERPKIFISYQHSSKQTVIKLKDRLRSKGYDIWIDTDDMCGSIGDDIIEGIHRSSVVLICLSQKYYESPYCKKELIYADESHKELIPLTMEPKYKPHGWLSFRMSDKLRIDFSQPQSFDESFRTLLQRLEKTLVETPPTDSISPQPHNKGYDETDEGNEAKGQREVQTEIITVSYSTTTTVSVHSWKKEHVREWLERNSLSHLIKWFEDFDGRLLLEYQFTLERCPQLIAPSFIAANSVADFMRVNMALREL